MYHNAGADGYGSSSYIDTTILRDYDTTNGWTGAGDGSFAKREYYCHNWRGDVVARVNAAGQIIERDKYSAYGIPYGIPRCDTNGDGTVNSADLTNVSTWWGVPASPLRPTADFNMDGNVDVDDYIQTLLDWNTLGWGKLSVGGAAGGNRKGYAGYEFDPGLAGSNWHVRHRVLNSDLGRWPRRDPAQYVDGANQYCYAHDDPVDQRDAKGLDAVTLQQCRNIELDCGGFRCGASFMFAGRQCEGKPWFIVEWTISGACKTCTAEKGKSFRSETIYERFEGRKLEAGADYEGCDVWSWPGLKDTRDGYFTIDGRVTFFCEEDMENLNPGVDPWEGWHGTGMANAEPLFTFCDGSAHNPWLERHTHAQPPWWNLRLAEQQRYAKGEWNCCGECSTWTTDHLCIP